jgi:hypothetical protein
MGLLLPAHVAGLLRHRHGLHLVRYVRRLLYDLLRRPARPTVDARVMAMNPTTATALSCALGLAAAACSGSHMRPPGGDGGPRDGGGRSDAGNDAATICMIDCAGPPAGCRYEGEVSCDPPRCPPLVCDDAGTCAACPAPPTGCNYADPCTCTGLVCKDVACGPGADPRFPDFDRSCTTEADCFVAMHLTDCCGSQRAMGISTSETDRFSAAEAACASMYPACGCFSDAITADDGSMGSSSTGDAPTLACDSGICATSF